MSENAGEVCDHREKVETKSYEKPEYFLPGGKRAKDSLLNYLSSNGFSLKISEGQINNLFGLSNRVYRFYPENGNPVVVKVFSDSGEDRKIKFDRELLARSYLTNKGIFSEETGVVFPKIEYADIDRGIIFVEDIGSTTSLANDAWNEKKWDWMSRSVVDFLVRLNDLHYDEDAAREYPYYSKYASVSAHEIYLNSLKRVKLFEDEVYKEPRKSTIKKWLYEKDFLNILNNRINESLNLIDPYILHHQTQPEEMRFNWGDVSPVNLATKKTDKGNVLAAFDLEYAGWDHFSAGLTSFLLHHQSDYLPLDFKQSILNLFVKNSRLSDEEIAQLDARLIIEDLSFISRKLVSVIKPAIENPVVFHSKRSDRETWSQTKISVLLEPALQRLENRLVLGALS